jgi:hypothetical protein
MTTMDARIVAAYRAVRVPSAAFINRLAPSLDIGLPTELS